MNVFNLPDLGEGLPDAEIVEWHIQEGDTVEADQPLVSMETAKAVVEVPSPQAGTVVKLYGGPGDVIETGKPLLAFGEANEVGAAEEPEPAEPAPSKEPTTGTDAEPTEPAQETAEASGGDDRPDSGTVVGKMETTDQTVAESYSRIGNVKISPAVRALARKLKIDPARVEPTGADNVVTAADVRRAAEQGQEPAPPPAGGETPAGDRPGPMPRSQPREPAPEPAPASTAASGEWEPIRGTRRTMARMMSESHRQIVPTSLMDDADIHAWGPEQDITVRLLRALWAGARVEPGLNAWFDGDQGMRMVHKAMDVGMAVDTEDGLFVAALRGVHEADPAQMRQQIDRLRQNVRDRSIPPEDMKDYTIMLSNFGVFAGRYATPIINPPCVAIVAAGKLRHEVVPVLGGFEVHRTIPLSLTFDHRACTGGEAARFLRAMLDDLALAE